MKRRNLAIVPALVEGRRIWRLIHIGWWRITVLAEDHNERCVVNAAEHISAILDPLWAKHMLKPEGGE
jgi:hypothetical protein